MTSITAAEEIDEEKERAHFRAVVSAFKYYKLCSLDRIQKSEKIISNLPASHQRRLSKYKTYLQKFKKCLDVNNKVVHLIIKDVDTMFENVDHSMDKTTNGTESFGCNYNNCEISSQKQHKMQHDVEKVQSVLKNLVRDWSDLGAAERKQCYTPILEELDELFPVEEYSDRGQIKVLVPGSGLGRLAWEIASRGYACQGNEFSLFMLVASNFILNRCPEANIHTVHPWVHQYVNNITCEHQLLGASFPDVPVLSTHETNFSITAGDFLKVYTESDEWSCVATCFFIDCAQNVIEFVERIYAILRPGGYWVNLGPLLYHYSDMPTESSIEPPYDILLEIIRDVGFDILTLIVKISSNGREKKVRALLDSGAQRSYIRAGLAEEMMLEVTGSERLGHIVFGGIKKGMQVHRHIDFEVSNLNDTYKARMTALEQPTLCGNLPKVNDASIIKKLQDQGIWLTDARESISDISLLIGSDYLGSLLEPDLVRVENNLVAIKTKLGWTLQGPIQGIYNTLVSSHFVATIPEDDSLEFLWNIETLGIKDPHDKEPEIKEAEMLKSFNETVSVNEEGRYEVSLMWKLGHPELESNYDQAYKRLLSTTKKLEHTKKIEDYHGVFQDWIDEGIIEEVVDDRKNSGHYLPHHAVIKLESATTKIRPVFDASAKDRNSNSLNACIEKGPNLIELIPKLLILFRAEAYGVISDIKKAFLQISVCPQDRKNLKLLWWKDPCKKNEVKTYQHARVPFGVACSPFLLAATINHHLKKHETKYQQTAKRLKESFYVDNCVTSFHSEEEKLKFIEEATKLMEIGKFELRGWMSNASHEDKTEPVLGVLWHRNTDKLQCHINMKSKLTEGVTKREILSVTQQVFDPLGLVCPVTLVPKLITQKVWSLKIGWDDKIPKHLEQEYNEWMSTLHYVNECQVPRRLATAPLQDCETSIHVFSDASKDAYAGCIFLRTKHENLVSVQLVIAKSRVTPIKRSMTLPRLELMGALIASRLYTEVKRSGLLKSCKEYEVYCWTDSSVVLAWLKRQNTWKTFIGNRVNEICKNTDRDTWNHLPGICNPADLPSRGCSAKTLQEKSWWLGPQWLYLEKENWPKSDLSNLKPDEGVISSEQLKNTAVNVEVNTEMFSRKLLYFNQYNKIVRLVARILRMSPRVRERFDISSEHITYDEHKNAEEVLIKLIQKEYYEEQTLPGQKLLLIKENEILKVKTKLEFSNEDKDFIYPILLPGKEQIVSRMVQEKHRTMGHAGTQTLMSSLRDAFWIVGIRRLTKRVVAECIICKRYKAKHYVAPQPPLPSDRVGNTAAFEVTGIDLAGPLFLKDSSKCWIVLFTCAVYRAIHLEITESLSTASFIMALRRFIARRGRVRIIYTDNGTNFTGTANLLHEVNWQEIESCTITHNIRWKFSAPAAPWWGGWWERLVRIVKEMLRRVLGKSVVNWIELSTILCDCEAVINSRPLTYVEMGELKPLTPMMFLHNLPTGDTPDLDQIDHKNLNIRHRYLQQLRENIRKRFKNEYLSLLINKGKERKREPAVGEVVFIETESSRLKWPIGIIKEIFTGKDGCTRTAKVITSSGEKVRAYQRLYPLELSASDDWIQWASCRNDPVNPTISQPADDDPVEPQVSVSPPATRSGRAIRLPSRFLD